MWTGVMQNWMHFGIYIHNILRVLVCSHQSGVHDKSFLLIVELKLKWIFCHALDCTHYVRELYDDLFSFKMIHKTEQKYTCLPFW
ncbi:hypothetical protein FRX31_011049 [Thalictrum thalictroides]|uniref:Uncharacterized protein n=1 Tax=Thalictrum thalictroides TaxID=46969 RepID=A0A7J6WSC9_THATH|nr:hypothetical protein FRX31_011049 [Thalictrum thalictroides]